MRSLAALVLLTSTVSWACPPTAPPPPPRAELALLTAPDATLPKDGALLVKRTFVARATLPITDDDAHWTVKDADGHDVALTVEDLGDGIERWRPTVAANRSLVVIDQTGKTIATVAETTSATKPLAAPRARITSNLVSRGAPTSGDEMSTLLLSAAAPEGAIFLAVSVIGKTTYGHSATALTLGQREITWASSVPSADYLRKPCAYPPPTVGPAPLVVGQRVGLTYVDALGRRSPTSKILVVKTR